MYVKACAREFGEHYQVNASVVVLNKSVSLFASVRRYAGSVDTVRSANCYTQTPNVVRLVIAAREITVLWCLQ